MKITHLPKIEWPDGMMPRKVETMCGIKVIREHIVSEKPTCVKCAGTLQEFLTKARGCKVVDVPGGGKAFVCRRGR